jgi:hypothetical protein
VARYETDLAQVLNPPSWLTCLAFAVVATGLACYPAWPGFMSYDSLMAYREAIYGVETMLWPPFHAYMFEVGRALGTDSWGVFLFQTFALFFSAALSIHLLVGGRRLALFLCVAFALAFIYVPSMAGSLFAHWRDVPTASFTLMGLALWLLAARRRSIGLLVLAIGAIGCALALRYNALMLAAPALALMVARPFLSRKPARLGRAVAAVAIAGVLGLAWASTQWRLPDLQRLPAPNSLGGTQEFDLIGISACADHSYLPLAVTAGQPVSPYQIRKAYDPRHLQQTLAPRPGVPRMVETDAGGEVASVWRRLIWKEWRCYLSHRSAVFVEQMGLAKGALFYASHEAIDPNPFGLRLAHPAAAAKVDAYIDSRAPEPWRRPALLYPLAALLAAAASLRRRGHALFLLAILAGAFAYPAALFVAAPAADARYIFPSNVLCALLIVISFGLLVGGERRGGRGAR